MGTSVEQVLGALERRLRSGLVTELLGDTLTHARPGAVLPPLEDSPPSEALAGGVFFRATRTGGEVITGYTWLHLGPMSDLADRYGVRLAQMSDAERFDLMAPWSMIAAVRAERRIGRP